MTADIDQQTKDREYEDEHGSEERDHLNVNQEYEEEDGEQSQEDSQIKESDSQIVTKSRDPMVSSRSKRQVNRDLTLEYIAVATGSHAIATPYGSLDQIIKLLMLNSEPTVSKRSFT